jgi:hypothetical protein
VILCYRFTLILHEVAAQREQTDSGGVSITEPLQNTVVEMPTDLVHIDGRPNRNGMMLF